MILVKEIGASSCSFREKLCMLDGVKTMFGQDGHAFFEFIKMIGGHDALVNSMCTECSNADAKARKWEEIERERLKRVEELLILRDKVITPLIDGESIYKQLVGNKDNLQFSLKCCKAIELRELSFSPDNGLNILIVRPDPYFFKRAMLIANKEKITTWL